MNPATDVGKKDLPAGIRNRFTELYVDELEDNSDLRILVTEYLTGLSLNAKQIDGIIKFYQIIRNEAVKKLVDGTGHKPHYRYNVCHTKFNHDIFAGALFSGFVWVPRNHEQFQF
jgi:midasin